MLKIKKGKLKLKLNKNQLILVLLSLALIAFITIFYVGIKKYSWEDSFTRKVASVIPYSAQKVGGSNVTYSQYLRKLDPLVSYNKNIKNIDFNKEEEKGRLKELKEMALNQLAEEVVIKKEAKKRNIIVENKELDDSFNELLKANGGEEKIKENLDKYYDGMSMKEFRIQYKDKMLRQKLSTNIEKDPSMFEGAKKQAEEVIKEVKAGGKFEDLAKKYSQDSTAQAGGDLGFFGKGKMVPDFEKVAFTLEKGGISDLVKTVYGYHIIKVSDKKGDEIKASHILIKTKDFNAWLEEKIKEYGVKRKIKV